MSVHRSAAVATLSLALGAWSTTAHAQSPMGLGPPLPQQAGPRAAAPDPSQYQFSTIDETVPDVGLITTGSVLLIAAYSASVVVGSTSDHPGDDRLFIPIAGPWIDLANRNSAACNGFLNCGNQENSNKVLLVSDGVVQGLGALMILGGIAFPEHHFVTRVAKAPVHFAPTFGRNGYGLSASGAF